MKDEDVKVGEHIWATCDGLLMVLLKLGDDSFYVCGPWDGEIDPNQIEIISIIDKPKGHLNRINYYG